MTQRTVLISGCSDGGIGAALAVAFHDAGFHVYATARNPAKMKSLQDAGIQTLTLDVQSEESIRSCVKSLDSLDILINNAGTHNPMPVVDMDISEAKKLFDLNVWSQIAVIQAFMPLLLRSSNAMIVNHTSSAAVTTVPFGGAYGGSKAAFSMMTDVLRLELQAFNVKVVDLRTGMV
jgi:1-acylglycerone phosphate reductase